MAEVERIQATGRRKTAVARVLLQRSEKPLYLVNGRPLKEYFPVSSWYEMVLSPLKAAKQEALSLKINVQGGGPTAQAGAARHGISRALVKMDPSLRGLLKEAGYLTRDPRMKERKQYGLKGRRRSFQYSKR